VTNQVDQELMVRHDEPLSMTSSESHPRQLASCFMLHVDGRLGAGIPAASVSGDKARLLYSMARLSLSPIAAVLSADHQISGKNEHISKQSRAAQLCSARGNGVEPVRTVGSVVGSDDASKRRVEQVTGLPFAFELAVA
jgi:hypothetical protein